VFGSRATGAWREGSDRDLAVEGLSLDSYLSALTDLMTLAGGRVDLVRLEEAPERLRARVRDERGQL
jgi:predicted nucleotidyltransferase